MADIFVSYKREDREFAERLVAALEKHDLKVWYDFELLSGDGFRKVIRRVIDQCASVVVLWSHRSAESEFVLDEATHAKASQKLCPVRIDNTPLPFGFGQLHTDDLTGWSGEESHQGFQRLLRSVQAKASDHRSAVGGAPQASASGREELSQFSVAQRDGSTEALKRFVETYPDSELAAVVRQDLRERAKLSNRFAAAPSWAKALLVLFGIALFAGLIFGLTTLSVERSIGGLGGASIEPLREEQLAALVRRATELSASGECSDELMATALLNACRIHAQSMQASISPLGPIIDVKSEGQQRSATGLGRVTRFFVSFRNGKMRWEATGTPDGKLATFWSSGNVDER